MPIVSVGGLLVSTDGWPLSYPAWFSALDRRRIDDALSAATASATLPATPATAPAHAVTGPLHGRLFASEADAIEAVLHVFTVVVGVLSTTRDGGPDEHTRRRMADQLFDELVVWIADLTPSVTTCDAFADRVRDTRETCPWWTAYAPLSPARAAAPAEPRSDGSPLLSLPADAPTRGVCRPTQLDLYLPFVRDTLAQYPRLRATRLFEMVRARGYPGSVVQLRRVVRTLRPQAAPTIYRRLTTLPAEDYGETGVMLSWARSHTKRVDVPPGRSHRSHHNSYSDSNQHSRSLERGIFFARAGDPTRLSASRFMVRSIWT